MRTILCKSSITKIAVIILSVFILSSATGYEPCAHAQLFKALRLKSKANKVMEQIQTRHHQGQDVRKEIDMAKQVKVLADDGKLDEANALLDEILKELDNNNETVNTSTVVFQPGETRKNESDKFGVWISTLEGKNLKLLISDPKRQMSHTRVSPDKQWVMFTRYNNLLRDGYAYEKGGYKNTEICVMRWDGSDLKTILGPKPGVLNCNGSWTQDGKSILYLSTDNPKKRPLLYLYDFNSGKISQVKTPDHLKAVSDPHQIGDKIVFPAPSAGSDPAVLWIMNSDGSNARQLTHPDGMVSKKRGPHPPGDYDPRISPDGTKVAVMRNLGKDIYHIIIVDIATGEEKDISNGNVAEGVAHWSSDGKLLIFRHVDPKNLKTYGLYTISPDGTRRERIPLPKGVLHSVQPDFFPGEGSSSKDRIIFSTEKVKFLD